MFTDMEKPKMKPTERQLKGRYLVGPARVQVSQFPDKPAAVPLDEWEQYQQLVRELEGAEYFVHDIRQRLQTVKQLLARRIEDQHCRVHESLENLIQAVPVTDLLQ